MSFTDKDLIELKELTKTTIYWSPKIPALLARLEAAEAYIADPWSENLIKWHKAAGKI